MSSIEECMSTVLLIKRLLKKLSLDRTHLFITWRNLKAFYLNQSNKAIIKMLFELNWITDSMTH
jgi:hypothetical protein